MTVLKSILRYLAIAAELSATAHPVADPVGTDRDTATVARIDSVFKSSPV